MGHLTGFGLKNFRVFKEKTWFDFAPITVLTGPNNSGKSSLIKAILMQKENKFTEHSILDSLKFSTDNSLLGDFNSCISDNNSENNEISFYFPFHFRYIQTELILRLSFKVVKNNEKVKLTYFKVTEKKSGKIIFDFYETKSRHWNGKVNFIYIKNEINNSLKEGFKIRKKDERLNRILIDMEDDNNSNYFSEKELLDENDIKGAYFQEIFPLPKKDILF
ncbi:MAG: AAA family ATPase [Bacteroidota bacterium]|nr:AAA family ATPase [Bacteroidota bacterium]